MGKKLDALLGRTFKASKFKALVNLAISRLAVLKNQREVRGSQARSDVVHLLNLGHHERALLRVEQVIKEQNMLNVFVMIEGYCHLLMERVVLIENNKQCPDELKEAISSLIFAASRCGEFPELQELRAIFTSRFGKEFAARAVELRNNCQVNPKIIQKMSTRQPNLESRSKVLKEIASENGISLHLEQERMDQEQKQNHHKPDFSANLEGAKLEENIHSWTDDIEKDEQFSGSMRARKKYRDVATAAQAAFESAAFAAAAARAAVELSRSESHDKDPDDHSGSTPRWRNELYTDGSSRAEVGVPSGSSTAREDEVERLTAELASEKIHPVDDSGSQSESEELKSNYGKINPEEFKESKNKSELERSPSDSSADSDGDDEGRTEQGAILWVRHSYLGFNWKSRLPEVGAPKVRKLNATSNESYSEDSSGGKLDFPTQKSPLKYQSDLLMNAEISKSGSGYEDVPMSYSGLGTSRFETTHKLDSDGQISPHDLNIEKRPVSVRTRGTYRW
ncbi:PREDICTED: uncharacterized protein LOC104601677 isoform X2 [Nelumbo nucifera]|uniref:Uncharacterized protein LOC104601677 isoform X2 n=1 Tax=Nelumbo nucifera TaxID=4432 RepID=A0A1U8A7Y0_NELNU|nr:PREDICTED: uncharacterized protein LOC104601677 isoform X2 [Nelumbo nucifera]